jgi:L-seryl-tRNA(Ser) seleniumtransferase
VRDEPRPRDALAIGAHLVSFSGDKLLGGPQAGILAGKAELVAKLRGHPLARALRIDKLSLAALESTLRLYRDGRAAEIPLVQGLALGEQELERRAQALAEAICATSSDLPVEIIVEEALIGGGSLPLARLPTRVVLIGPAGEYSRRLAAALRRGEPPIISRVVADRVAIDVRTLGARDLPRLARLVAAARTRIHSE